MMKFTLKLNGTIKVYGHTL